MNCEEAFNEFHLTIILGENDVITVGKWSEHNHHLKKDNQSNYWIEKEEFINKNQA